jgi:hypothetical protein
VESFSFAFPAIIICELLGIPDADRHAFRRWTDAIVSTRTSTSGQVQETYLHLADYLASLFAQRRARPGSDLLTWLVQARDNQDRLTEAELLFLGMALLVGGYETTAHQITNLVYALLIHRPQLRQLKARPELLPDAVEEMLRFIVFGNAAAPQNRSSADSRACAGSGQPLPSPWIALRRVPVTAPGQTAGSAASARRRACATPPATRPCTPFPSWPWCARGVTSPEAP